MKRKVILSALKKNILRTKPDFQDISLNKGYTQRLFTQVNSSHPYPLKFLLAYPPIVIVIIKVLISGKGGNESVNTQGTGLYCHLHTSL